MNMQKNNGHKHAHRSTNVHCQINNVFPFDNVRHSTNVFPFTLVGASHARPVKKSHRQETGSKIPEFAVCLFVLVLLIFFPMVDFIGLFATYFTGIVLVNQQAHEAAMLNFRIARDPQGPILQDLPRSWKASALGNFANVVGAIDTNIGYGAGVSDEFGFEYKEILVVTRMWVRPFISCPFPMPVPGLNAPVELVLRSRRLIEDPTNAPPV